MTASKKPVVLSMDDLGAIGATFAVGKDGKMWAMKLIGGTVKILRPDVSGDYDTVAVANVGTINDMFCAARAYIETGLNRSGVHYF